MKLDPRMSLEASGHWRVEGPDGSRRFKVLQQAQDYLDGLDSNSGPIDMGVDLEMDQRGITGKGGFVARFANRKMYRQFVQQLQSTGARVVKEEELTPLQVEVLQTAQKYLDEPTDTPQGPPRDSHEGPALPPPADPPFATSSPATFVSAFDNCPQCSTPLEYDEVDIGVGVQRGNYRCNQCGWTPAAETPEQLDARLRSVEGGSDDTGETGE